MAHINVEIYKLTSACIYLQTCTFGLLSVEANRLPCLTVAVAVVEVNVLAVGDAAAFASVVASVAVLVFAVIAAADKSSFERHKTFASVEASVALDEPDASFVPLG